MVDELAGSHPQLIKWCKRFSADWGYDDGKPIVKHWDEYKIKPVIDIRNLWQDQDLPTITRGSFQCKS